MSNIPLISIITVTKNCVSTIEHTLSSIEVAKTSEIEYIVIDGESTDGTVELIASRIRLVDHFVSECDSGIYNAMNKGVGFANGRYILFINGDDQVVFKGLHQVLPHLRSGFKDVYCANTLALSNGHDEVLAMNQWLLPFYNSVPHPSAFVRASLLKQFKFREDLKIAADYDLFLRLFMARKSFQRIDVVSATHHRGGASGNILQSSLEVNRVRKERLGLIFYITEFALALNRLLKKFMSHFREIAK